MTCPNCGGTLIGDGHTMVIHCEFTDPWDQEKYPQGPFEPDAGPIYCEVLTYDPL